MNDKIEKLQNRVEMIASCVATLLIAVPVLAFVAWTEFRDMRKEIQTLKYERVPSIQKSQDAGMK